MHELPIIQQVVSAVLDYASKTENIKINKVYLDVGEFHDIIPKIAERYFKFACQGTMIEGSELIIKTKPIICQCNECNTMFVYHLRFGVRTEECSNCGSRNKHKFVSGDEFVISKIEIQDEM